MVSIPTTMTETAGILRLMSWLSPVFPTGGFAYSSGLEAAVQARIVTNEAELGAWLLALLQYGYLRNETCLLTDAFKNNGVLDSLEETAELALALSGSAERYLESTAQGGAFVEAVQSWPQMNDMTFPDPCPLAVPLGRRQGDQSLTCSTR